MAEKNLISSGPPGKKPYSVEGSAVVRMHNFDPNPNQTKPRASAIAKEKSTGKQERSVATARLGY